VTVTADGERLVRGVARSARAQMAAKSALAAAMSWVIAEALTRTVAPEADGYMYYAPLGAVVATYPNVLASARTARETVWALLLGAALGLAVHLLFEPGLLPLAVVVGVGVALGALPGLGEHRSWVPIVALFVLVIGGRHPMGYAAAYVGLTAIGALCGVVVNVLLPALPLQQSSLAVGRLRRLLGDQLAEVAQGLREATPPGTQGWERRRRDIDEEVERTRLAVRDLLESQHGNLRARFHHHDMQRQDQVARVLGRVAVLVHDLMAVLSETHREGLTRTPLDPELRGAVASALEELRELVLVYDPELTADHPQVHRAEEAIARLTAAFDQRRGLDADDLAVLGTVVANLRWSALAVRPR
jgi:uncharacterized membrane protein YgaE (UPF0421/DUF939 family)